MRIAAIAATAVFALLAGASQAQVQCWTTKDGKRACGDTPPPGVKTTAISAPAAPPTSSAPADASSKAAKKGSPEQEYQKRQADAQKARDKEQQAQQDAKAKQENCERARNSLRILESGQRISRVDKEGERYFLEEQEISQETQRARESVQRNCS